MSQALSAKDANAAMASAQEPIGKPDVKSMEYHRQVLQNKMQQGEYVQTTRNWNSAQLARLLTFCDPQDQICLPVGQHHEPLHGQAERFPQQAGWEVRSTTPLPAPASTLNPQKCSPVLELTSIAANLGSSQSRSSPRPPLRSWRARVSLAAGPRVLRKPTEGLL